jgi:hypothetical protein
MRLHGIHKAAAASELLPFAMGIKAPAMPERHLELWRGTNASKPNFADGAETASETNRRQASTRQQMALERLG